MSVTELNDYAEYTLALKNAGEKLVVLDFYAEWCGPCKRLSPELQKFAEKFTDTQFYKVDVDKHQELTTEYSIRSMPTIIYIKNGASIDKTVGANVAELSTKLTLYNTTST